MVEMWYGRGYRLGKVCSFPNDEIFLTRKFPDADGPRKIIPSMNAANNDKFHHQLLLLPSIAVIPTTSTLEEVCPRISRHRSPGMAKFPLILVPYHGFWFVPKSSPFPIGGFTKQKPRLYSSTALFSCTPHLGYFILQKLQSPVAIYVEHEIMRSAAGHGGERGRNGYTWSIIVFTITCLFQLVACLFPAATT